MRTLLAVMLVAALSFAWFGWRLRKSQRQMHAISVLQSVGAVYAYDYEGPISRATRHPWTLSPTPGRSRYPRWLHKRLGVDFLHNITRVHLETSYRLADDDIDRLWNALADLPNLTHLEASGPVTRPGAILHLRHARRLQALSLRWATIADDDLAVLAQLPQLQELNLNETPVSDAAFEHVGRIRNLRAIELHHTLVTDDGLRQIAKLSRLQRLRLSGTKIGNEGVAHLRRLNQLSDLNLEHTNITDSGLEHVAAIPRLHRLDLSLNTLSRNGLMILAQRSQLKSLRLEGTTAGPDALAAITKLPALEELQIAGPIMSGDLSALADCAKLRVLHSSLMWAESSSLAQRLKLPQSLQEISGVKLSDVVIEELAALPNLEVVHVLRSTLDPEQVAAVQKLQDTLAITRPAVQVR
jgi:internalin A